ncbi:hypothetical protein ACFQ9X_52215 [Catenulispora yoronensis]
MADGSSADLLDLYRWLADTRSVATNSSLGVSTSSEDGMASAGNVIGLAADEVSSVSAVVQAYGAWRETRTSAPAITVVVAGGAPLTVATGSEAEFDAVTEAAEAARGAR